MALPEPNVNDLALQVPTLADLAKFGKIGEGQNLDVIAELLAKNNAIIQDCPLVEANGYTEHMSAYEISMPKAYVAEFNRGVPASHATIGQRRESLCMFEARSSVDVRLYEMQGENAAKWRFFQDKRFIRSMNDAVSEMMFYGESGKNISHFDGFATRYGTLDDKKSQNARQVFSMGGKKDTAKSGLSSIYAVAWGDSTCHGLYPKGGSGTIKYTDYGAEIAFDKDKNPYHVYTSVYNLTLGLAIPDFRSVVRICNIDIDQILNGDKLGTGVLNKDGSTNILIEINSALRNLDPTHNASKVVLYANKDVMAGLENCMIRSDALRTPLSTVLDSHNPENTVPEIKLFGYTIKQCDAISSNEAEVK